MNDGGDIVDRTMFTLQIAFVGKNDCAEDGFFLPEKDGFHPECGKVRKCGQFHDILRNFMLHHFNVALADYFFKSVFASGGRRGRFQKTVY